ncbi:alpha,alpha-trehalase nth1 [Neophaeococcomyces mojaviensis]|uniref:Alpha,alpha-trehalase nth1 n=1 Tax=Neophaeococcomyces mojaviensis TaxID=3383035 RepID=A0ACC3A4B0_9EURO|nr:alpha,alpha-trehalase nth1 [Knufia sp. JES_112]
MRTSKISQETTRIFSALSPNARSTRTTRSAAKGIATFALGYDGTVEVKEEGPDSTLQSTPSVLSDIEDVGSPPRTSRKRKRSADTATIVKTEHKATWASSRKRQNVKHQKQEAEIEQLSEAESQAEIGGSPQTPRRSQPKLPAKRSKSPGGTATYVPPSNWETIYNLVRDFRRANPIAPVDTMGCEDLYWVTAPPAQKRYHTLTALMLSSQTKDTVTAAAMQRLHTELIPNPPLDPGSGKVLHSSLTIPNILACDPVHLDSLIGKVGFHNTKTKHIQQVAQILSTRYNNDIPDSIEGLVSLPGVGPKMGYLCMSAAWGQDIGIGVDVHVHRITNLWGWHVTKAPEQTREWLEGWLPKEKWHEINKVLVGFGQTVCLPVGRRCGECPLAGKGLCKAEIKGWVKKEERKKTTTRVKSEKVEIEVEQEKAVLKDEDDDNVLTEKKVTVKEEVVDS